MGLATTELTKHLCAVLADGQWHYLEELVVLAADWISDGVAQRTWLSDMHNEKRLQRYRSGRTFPGRQLNEAEQVVAGRRRLVRQRLTQSPLFERDGARWRTIPRTCHGCGAPMLPMAPNGHVLAYCTPACRATHRRAYFREAQRRYLQRQRAKASQ